MDDDEKKIAGVLLKGYPSNDSISKVGEMDETKFILTNPVQNLKLHFNIYDWKHILIPVSKLSKKDDNSHNCMIYPTLTTLDYITNFSKENIKISMIGFFYSPEMIDISEEEELQFINMLDRTTTNKWLRYVAKSNLIIRNININFDIDYFGSGYAGVSYKTTTSFICMQGFVEISVTINGEKQSYVYITNKSYIDFTNSPPIENEINSINAYGSINLFDRELNIENLFA